MTLDPDICYRAVESRDARFDGRFFTAVLTTGVYCRPVCPARTPQQKNVRFYSCAAAAEQDGFRPCMRCRPETSPGTPAWAGTSATVARALRLISEGALDDGGVDDLAGRLGVTARHLRRLFDEHVGASPLAVARARRVHFAKTLLDGTGLPITEIALTSGFSSIRRFNAAFLDTFGQAPSQVRRTKRADAAHTRGILDLKLTYRPPMAWNATLGFLSARAIHGVEEVTEKEYRRAVSIDGASGIVTVAHSAADNSIRVRLPLSLSQHARVIADRVRRLFDLGADPAVINRSLHTDPMLATLVRTFPGLRVPGAWDPFETSVRVILGQQITVKAARTLATRIAEKYGTPLTGEPSARSFPGPDRLRRARLEILGVIGSRSKAIRRFASMVDDGKIRLDGSVELDELTGALEAMPGIGPWTSQAIAMRACGEPDAFPAADLGALHAAKRIDLSITNPKQLTARAEAWRPWRAYGLMHLWNSLSSEGEKQ